ncbi:hypothetical protein [Gordonia sp. (in: high G+C Gram-positive bacteria)]|uniref:hypothetical protein n=1 Tax=Gordonia sp. (in: high G+C Gram-positive bacteria) TaxID=84139 RepID=UPI003F97493C
MIYLHNSTINNSPLKAESAIWPALGNAVGPGAVGVRPRLFKSGVLCEALDYQYNASPTTKFVAATSATCGNGSYNSHGFVTVWDDAEGYKDSITFPSNPLSYKAPTARSSFVPSVAETGRNGSGQSFGSGADAKSDQDGPDLIAAYATNGKLGYVKRQSLASPKATSPQQARSMNKDSRSIDVFQKDGKTVVGTFKIG